MMYLTGLDDPGMVVLPAHRLLLDIEPSMLETLIKRAERYFSINSYPYTPESGSKGLQQFIFDLQSNSHRNCLGVYMRNDPSLYTLSLKEGVMASKFSGTIPDALLDIDVTVLTRLVMMELLEFDEQRLDDEKRIRYASRTPEALAAVDAGRCDVAFILNPTKLSQVTRVAEKGLIMPRKATYFYPKVIAGQVLNSLER